MATLHGDRVSLRGNHLQLRILLQTACRTRDIGYAHQLRFVNSVTSQFNTQITPEQKLSLPKISKRS